MSMRFNLLCGLLLLSMISLTSCKLEQMCAEGMHLEGGRYGNCVQNSKTAQSCGYPEKSCFSEGVDVAFCQADRCGTIECLAGYHLIYQEEASSNPEYNYHCVADSAESCGVYDVNCIEMGNTDRGYCKEGRCLIDECDQDEVKWDVEDYLINAVCVPKDVISCGTEKMNCMELFGHGLDVLCDDGVCRLGSCLPGYHRNSTGDACIEDSDDACGEGEVVCGTTPEGHEMHCLYGECRMDKCGVGYHVIGHSCVWDTVSVCGGAYLDCEAIDHVVDVVCEGGMCRVKQCEGDFVPYRDRCLPDGIKKCGDDDCTLLPHGIEVSCVDEQCVVERCEDGYHLMDNRCEADRRDKCDLEDCVQENNLEKKGDNLDGMETDNNDNEMGRPDADGIKSTDGLKSTDEEETMGGTKQEAEGSFEQETGGKGQDRILNDVHQCGEQGIDCTTILNSIDVSCEDVCVVNSCISGYVVSRDRLSCEDCQSRGMCENTVESCRDGMDNDGNGMTDCEDEKCDGFRFCHDDGKTYFIFDVNDLITYQSMGHMDKKKYENVDLETDINLADVLQTEDVDGDCYGGKWKSLVFPDGTNFYGNNHKMIYMKDDRQCYVAGPFIGNIKNVSLNDIEIAVDMKPDNEKDNLNGVISSTENCTLSNFVYRGKIECLSGECGVVSYVYGGNFSNIRTDVQIRGRGNYVGGLIGKVLYNENNILKLEKIFNIATVEAANFGQIGGMVGSVSGTMEMDDISNDVRGISCSSISHSGGVIGSVKRGSVVKINNMYNSVLQDDCEGNFASIIDDIDNGTISVKHVVNVVGGTNNTELFGNVEGNTKLELGVGIHIVNDKVFRRFVRSMELNLQNAPDMNGILSVSLYNDSCENQGDGNGMICSKCKNVYHNNISCPNIKVQCSTMCRNSEFERIMSDLTKATDSTWNIVKMKIKGAEVQMPVPEFDIAGESIYELLKIKYPW